MLVDTTRTWTQVGVVDQSGSKLQSLGSGHELSLTAVDPMGTETRALISRTANGHRGTSDTSGCCPGQLDDNAGPRTLAFVTWDSWSTLPAVGHEAESPRRAGRPPGHSDTITRCPGQLVEPAGSRTMARGARPIWSTPRSFGPGPESPRTAGRSCRPSNPCYSRPGQLVNSAGHRT